MRGACDNGPVTHPRIFDFTSGADQRDLEQGVALVRGGHVIGLPPDTVYGIGADAANPHAVDAVLAAKGRGRHMPPPVLVAHPEAIDAFAVDVPPQAHRLAKGLWPGGLTLILRARPDLGWDLGETGGTIALRMPDHAVTLALLEATGPMAVTSANLTAQTPATSIDQAIAYFGDTVAAYVNSGPTPGATPSSIIDVSGPQARAIRLGTVALEELERVAGQSITPPS